jgi:4,5-DOPA dioxygenase extradiol
MTEKAPALYIGHGAPLLIDDPIWSGELANWAQNLNTPTAILIISAHWESAPIAVSSVNPHTPLFYDFYGFPQKYYQLQYDAPVSPELVTRIRQLLNQEIHIDSARGLDHGAFIPLLAMYPKANIPVVQLSIPTFKPEELFKIGQKLAPLRDEGVAIIGSGFLTHGLPFLKEFRIEATPPSWSVDFDLWAKAALEKGNIEELFDFKNQAPGMPYAHPTVEHFAPIFITLGASSNPESAIESKIDGYWMGLAKRSFQVN